MGKHRADTPEPLPTLATSLASSTASTAGLATTEAPRPETQFVEPVVRATPAPGPAAPPRPAAVAPPLVAPAPSGSGSSPIPAPVLTTPRRSRIQVETPATVKVACWTAIVMSSLHAIAYAVVATQIASLRGGATEGARVDGLLPGQSIAADAGGVLTLWALLAGLAAVACLAAVGVAVLALKRSSSGRIATITFAGAAAALSLGPVFGDGSLWWLVTLFAAGLTGGLLTWDGWWYDDSVKLRR